VPPEEPRPADDRYDSHATPLSMDMNMFIYYDEHGGPVIRDS